MVQDAFKHSYKNASRENLALTVYNCGFQRCTSGYSWGPGYRDHFLIHYVVSGKGHYTLDGDSYTIGPGDAFFSPPRHAIHYWADNDDPWEYYWVGFNGTEAERLINLTPFSSQAPVMHYEDKNVLKPYLLRIYESVGATPCQEAQMVGGLYLFLSCLMEASGKESSHSSGIEYVEKATRFVQYNYSRSIDVSDIANHVGVSRSHLYRIFIRHLGLSPNDFLIRFRINEACSLLRKARFSIGEISCSVGFQDQLYFSRQFKKIKGVSPSKYLLSLKQEEEIEEGGKRNEVKKG